MLPENYIEKTYAGWLGKVIGIRMGAPIEGWSKEKIQLMYGNRIKNYLVDYHDFASDDDSNGPLYFIRGLEHYKKITPREMGYTYLNYVPKEHGFFWWGNELSTEHTAYKNLLAGVEAPESGSAEKNGRIMAEQIGGQIFIDGFGFVAPGNPGLACELAKASARVTHDLEGTQGASFIAACISLAYVRTSIDDIIKEAFSYINKEGKYYQVAAHMIKCKEEGKSKEEAFAVLRKDYWTDQYPGVCHIIPNGGIIVLALLYGEGSFSKTMELVNLCGFDTDCNAGNVGAIMGVFCGIRENENDNGIGIPVEWITPIQDVMIASGIVGSLNISTLSENTLLFSKLGYQLAGEVMPIFYKEVWEQLEKGQTRTAHFEFQKAIHGFRIKGSYKNAEVHISNSKEYAYQGKHSLKITINNLHPKNNVFVYQKSYYVPEDLHDARYQPCFSSIIYPGDEVSCYLINITGQKLKAYLYCYDLYQKKRIRFGEVSLVKESLVNENLADHRTGSWILLSGKIPEMKNVLIKEIGIELVSLEVEDTYFGEQVCVFMDQFITKGCPSYEMDFSQIPLEDYSLHQTKQIELSGFTHYNPTIEGITTSKEGLILSGGEKIFTGDYYWKDYNYEVKFALLSGNQADFLFRNQGSLRSYALRLTRGTMSVLYFHEKKEYILGQADITIEYDKEYTALIQICDNIIRISMEGNSIVTKDKDNRYPYGAIGMQVDAYSSVKLVRYGVTSLAETRKGGEHEVKSFG